MPPRAIIAKSLVLTFSLFEKRPIIQNIKVANKIRETTSSISVNHLVRRDLPIGTLNVFFDAT